MSNLLAEMPKLSGLLPREALSPALEAAATQARAHSQTLAVLTLDLDHFRAYRDEAGPAQAQLVIDQLAALLMQGKPATAQLAHLGGDEFVLLLPATDLPAAAALAETLRETVATAFATLPGPLTITAGVAASPLSGSWSASVLLALADARMTFAKRRLLPHHNLVWAGTLPSDWYLRLDIEPGVWPSL